MKRRRSYTRQRNGREEALKIWLETLPIVVWRLYAPWALPASWLRDEEVVVQQLRINLKSSMLVRCCLFCNVAVNTTKLRSESKLLGAQSTQSKDSTNSYEWWSNRARSLLLLRIFSYKLYLSLQSLTLPSSCRYGTSQAPTVWTHSTDERPKPIHHRII